jgi:ComF family protein
MTAFDAAYSFGSYENELRQLIHLFKYGGVQTLARPLSKLMIKALPREHPFDAIAPMPLHWLKQWRRGFNQSELLAREVSRIWNVPVRKLARRVRPTLTQAGLTGAERRDNVKRAFRANRAAAGKRILLVDDVMTTGATASACAEALKKAGALRVTLLTLARVDRRPDAAILRDSDFLPESTILGSVENAESGSIA